MTRIESIALGLKRYSTNKPCGRGHIAERYVRNKSCVTCSQEDQTNRKPRPNWYKLNPEKGLAIGRRYRGVPEPTRPRPDRCEVRGCLPGNGKGGLVPDHDHITGKFRGWACLTCNTGLGKLGDTIESVETVLHYLRKNS